MKEAVATVVQPADPLLRSAICLALAFAGFKLLLHLGTNLLEPHLGYSYFRDEFYYIACGRHLAWGYVDHGPVVAVQARVAESIFGTSVPGIRVFSAVAGAVRVLLTGLLTWTLGGWRAAQALAMLCVLIAPEYLALDGYLSMNSCESMFWMTSLLALIWMIRRRERGDSRESWSLWILFGLSAGTGLLNKPSMTFFLAALLFGLLLTPQRRLLVSRPAALGIALLILVALPNLLWQAHHHWPTLEFLRNGRLEKKNVVLGPLAFLREQIKNLNPGTLLVWGAGLASLMRQPQARLWRWIGLTFLFFFALMLALHAKDYYLAPIYPVLFAAGGVAWERRFPKRSHRLIAFPMLEGALVVSGILTLPLTLPVLRPQTWIAYTRAMHLADANTESENQQRALLPQFYADRFGWQQEVEEVTRIIHSLSPEDQRRVGILCSNYGEAGALNLLGRDLPVAVSGHNSFWLWGPHGYTGDLLVVIDGATPEQMREAYRSVEILGKLDHPLAMPFEHHNIYLVRGRRENLLTGWAALKHYI